MRRRLTPLTLLLPLALACVARSPAIDTTGSDTTGSDTTDASTAPTPTTTDPTSTSTEPTPTTAGPTCEDYTATLQIPILAVQLMLVLDQSPAMLDPWDHDGDPQTAEVSRWSSLRNALLTVLPAQPKLRLDLGLAPFPTADADDSADEAACKLTPNLLVPTSDAPPADVLAALPPAVPPPGSFVGGAPIRRALIEALPKIADTPGDPRVLFIFANSAPNCDPDAPDQLESLDAAAVDAAASALAMNVPVYVFGIGAATTPSPALADDRPDGVVVADELTALAGAGGGTFFNALNEAELITMLALQFETEGSSCTISVDPAPGPDQAITGVRVDDQDFPPVDDCATQDGWRPVGAAEIQLCGEACTRFQTTPDVEIFVACV